MQVSAAAASHPGLRRSGNEDAYCCRPDLGLYAVADGMGGHVAGEIASQLAVEVIADFVGESKRADAGFSWPFPFDESITIDGNRLAMAFRLAHRRLGAAVEADEELRGMATTVAAVLLNGGPVVAHVGDSRVYLLREGQLEPITQDHSWVGEQVRAGMMSDADAQRHPWRNVVTRAIGGGADPEVEINTITLKAGDRLLLCSDGLSAVVAHEQLESLMAARGPLQDGCNALIEAANDAGGPDNITVLMLHVDVA